ncbi:helix-turn-helix domain-containing protein [Spirillospora sp. NPDC049652]
MAHQTVGDAARPGLPDDPRAHVTEPIPACPVEVTLAALRGRWTTLVIRELLHGERTYTELRRALPALSDKVLSDRLAHLSSVGVLTRRRVGGWPPTTHYDLTPQGRDLGPVLQALWDWGATHPLPAPSI